jgi:hypothetical protein
MIPAHPTRLKKSKSHLSMYLIYPPLVTIRERERERIHG